MCSKVEQVMRTMIGELRFKKAVQLGSGYNAQHRAFRAALRGAYTLCARHYYPNWASYLLDEEFQAHGADRLRACYLRGSPASSLPICPYSWPIRWVGG